MDETWAELRGREEADSTEPVGTRAHSSWDTESSAGSGPRVGVHGEGALG